jgi:hypothetical protein
MAHDRLDNGMGERGPEQRRIATLERFIRQFRKTPIIAKDVNGDTRKFDVLAITNNRTDEPAVGSGGGAFFTMRTVESGGSDNGDIYLQGGNVSGGTGNETVAEFLLYDASTTTWTGSSGELLQLEITGSGQETSGILDPIFNVTSVATPTTVASLAANTLPASGSVAAKKCHVSLGTFLADGFQPAQAGNINVSFCWGGYTASRG